MEGACHDTSNRKYAMIYANFGSSILEIYYYEMEDILSNLENTYLGDHHACRDLGLESSNDWG